MISGTWNSNYREKVLGYVVLLHNEDEHCLQSLIFGKIKSHEYHTNIQSLFISCHQISRNVSVKPDALFYFENLDPDKTYTVYIFGTLSYKDTTSIDKIQYRTLNPKFCFENCLNSNLLKCNKQNTDTPCIEAKYNMYIDQTFEVKWIDYNKNASEIFLLLLYQNDSCDLGIKIGEEELDAAFNKYYDACKNKSSLPKLQYEFKFNSLKKHSKYNLFIVPYIQLNEKVPLKRIQFDTDCFTDCHREGSYLLKSTTSSLSKCLPWASITNETKKSNFCYGKKTNAYCFTSSDEKSTCLSTPCDVNKDNDEKSQSCIDVTEIVKTDYTIKVSFKMGGYLGYVALLHNSQDVCERAIVSGKLKLNQYDRLIQGYYKACDEIKYNVDLTYEFTFDGLLSARMYKIYIFKTLSNSEISNIKILNVTTKLPDFCYEDCKEKRSEYLGLRFKDKKSCTDLTINCDIPICKETHQDMFCPKVDTKFNIYGHGRLTWFNPDSKMKRSKYLLLLLNANFNMRCELAVITGSKNADEFKPSITNLYSHCNTIYYIETFVQTFEFRDLIPSTKYNAYVAGILNEKEIGFFNRYPKYKRKYTRRLLPDCFKDCFLDHPYIGLRSVTKSGVKCGLWKSNFQGKIEETRTGSLCVSQWGKVICSTGKYTTEECLVEPCNSTKEEDSLSCVEEVKVIFNKTIRTTWKSPNKKCTTYVVLLYNQRGICEDSIVLGSIEPEEHDIKIKSFYMVCESTQYSSKLIFEHKFKQVQPPQNYSVYIFGINNSTDIPVIRKAIVFANLPRSGFCFRDCYHNNKYIGIQSRTKSGKVCRNTNATYGPWCYNENKELPGCMTRSGTFEDCTILSCRETREIYCVNAKLLQVTKDSAFISWTKPYMTYKDFIDQYMILVYKLGEEISCIRAYIIGDSGMETDKTRDFTLNCRSLVAFTHSELGLFLKIESLEKSTKYQIYITAFDTFDIMGYFNKEIIFTTDCLIDCALNGVYRGIRSVMKDGTTCLPWITAREKQWRTRLSNICYSHRKGAYCLNQNLTLTECDVPSCLDNNIVNRYCVKNVTISPLDNYMTFLWYPKDGFKSAIGHFAIFFDENHVCQEAVAFGSIKPDEYHNQVQGLFTSCSRITHIRKTKKLSFLYKFEDLIHVRNYTAYIFATFSKSKTSGILRITQETSKYGDTCHWDCQIRGRYSGIRFYSEKNHKCTYHKFKVIHHSCKMIQVYDKYCGNLTKLPKACNILNCDDRNTRPPCSFFLVTNDRSDNIHVEWISSSNNTNYLVLLYKTSPERVCQTAIVIGKYKPRAMGQHITNLYTGCRRLYFMRYFNPIKLKVQKNSNYMVYMSHIIDQYGIGNVHRASFSNIYNNFKDCRFKRLYFGMRSGTAKGNKCQPWKFYSQDADDFLRNKTSNFCTIIKGLALCSIGPGKLEMCSIPFCKDLTSSLSNNKILVNLNFTHDTIALSFMPELIPISRNGIWGYDGFVLLLYNYHYECLAAIILGASKPTDYDNNIRSFYISCRKISHQINTSTTYQFFNLPMDHIYTVYVFGVFNKKQTSQVSKNVFRTKMRSNCFNDCYNRIRYNGIRQRTRSNLVCKTSTYSKFKHIRHRWCQSQPGEKPWCYVKWNQKADCSVPKCSDDREDMFCPDVKYSVTDYNSLKVEWSYPNTKTNSKDSTLLLLYEIGDEELCQQAIIIGIKYIFILDKQVQDFYMACSYTRSNSDFIHNYEFFYLKPFTKYNLYATSILNENKVGFINKISFVTKSDPNILPECFEDCFRENRYFGIRSATTNGRKCLNWKSNFKVYPRNSRVSNRCFAEYVAQSNFARLCAIGKNLIGDCLIPDCENNITGTKICFGLNKVYSDQYLIKGTWSKPLPEQNVIGFVVLLHNEAHECKQSKVYGEIEPNDYSIYVRNFYLSCDKTSYSKDITYEYEFRDFQVPQKFTVYQFATFSESEVSKIQSIVYEMKDIFECFNDCYNQDPYRGIRMVNLYNSECKFYNTSQWCRNKKNEKPWCMAGDLDKRTECRVPSCRDSFKEVYCVQIRLTKITDNSISVAWTKPFMNKTTIIQGYLILLYEISDRKQCKSAIIMGPKTENLNVSVSDLFIGCLQKTNILKINNSVSFYDLYSNIDRQIYVTSIIDDSRIGFVRQRKIDPNCLIDCKDSLYYSGIRRITISGKKCLAWRFNFANKKYKTRTGNLCYKSDQHYICSTGYKTTEECWIPQCYDLTNKLDFCVKIIKSESTDKRIFGAWSRVQKGEIGYILLLHDMNGECLFSIVYGKLKPSEYALNVKSFFISCEDVRYEKHIKLYYQFDNLIEFRTYVVYIFATMSNSQTSQIKKVKYKTKSIQGFYDCQTNHGYTGIRSATVTGLECDPWNETSFNTNRTHNWCLFDNKRTFCIANSTGLHQDCPVPFCNNLTIQGSHSAVVLVNSIFSSNYIKGSWFAGDLGRLPLGYVVMLHNQNGECINSIVQGKIMPDDYKVSVRSFYISCQSEPLYSEKITYNFEFQNLQKGQRYSVYIFGTLSLQDTSKLIEIDYKTKGLEKGNSKHCFAHCVIENKYNSILRFYVGKILRCEKIKIDRNCIKTKYKIKEERMIEGTFSLRRSIVKKKGFIILLYGASKCHSAIIYGSFKMFNKSHDPVIVGFYKNCTDVKEYATISYRFRFMFPLKQDEYKVFLIPIFDEKSYGYVTKLIIFTQYRTATSEYFYGLVRAVFFLGMVFAGFILYGIKSKSERDRLSSMPEFSDADLTRLKKTSNMVFLSSTDDELFQNLTQAMTMPNTDDAQNQSKMNDYFLNFKSLTGSTNTTN